MQTIRFELIHQPMRSVKSTRRTELRFAVAPVAQRLIQRAERPLKRAA